LLKGDDEEAYKRQFSQFIQAGITPESLGDMYKKAHSAIRENPVHAKKEPKKPAEQKRWNPKKLTLGQRKNRISTKKAYLLHLKSQQESAE